MRVAIAFSALGLAAILAGITLIYPPAALIVGGLCLIAGVHVVGWEE